MRLGLCLGLRLGLGLWLGLRLRLGLRLGLRLSLGLGLGLGLRLCLGLGLGLGLRLGLGLGLGLRLGLGRLPPFGKDNPRTALKVSGRPLTFKSGGSRPATHFQIAWELGLRCMCTKPHTHDNLSADRAKGCASAQVRGCIPWGLPQSKNGLGRMGVHFI